MSTGCFPAGVSGQSNFPQRLSHFECREMFEHHDFSYVNALLSLYLFSGFPLHLITFIHNRYQWRLLTFQPGISDPNRYCDMDWCAAS